MSAATAPSTPVPVDPAPGTVPATRTPPDGRTGGRGPRRPAVPAPLALPARLRASARTTPGLLRIVSVGLTAAIVLLWAASFATVIVRQQAVHTLRADAGKAFIAAVNLHADLSAADATVANAFLAGQVEPAAARASYDASIATAATQLVTLGQAGGQPPTTLGVLASQIPVYTGLVDQARANNRQGFTVGVAYLRKASALMKSTILPAVDSLAALAAAGIDDTTRTATAWWNPVLVTVVGVGVLAGLLAAQWQLFRRTNRVVNPRLATATGLVVVIVALTLAGFAGERAQLLNAHGQGFVPMSEAAQARVLGLRVWGDESLSLLARGNGADLDADGTAAAVRLTAGGNGVLPSLTALTGPDEPSRADLGPLWQRFATARTQVSDQVNTAGGYRTAFRLALTVGQQTFGSYDQAAAGALAASQSRFTARVAAAGRQLDGLAGWLSALAAVAVLLTLTGLQVRINEYR